MTGGPTHPYKRVRKAPKCARLGCLPPSPWLSEGGSSPSREARLTLSSRQGQRSYTRLCSPGPPIAAMVIPASPSPSSSLPHWHCCWKRPQKLNIFASHACTTFCARQGSRVPRVADGKPPQLTFQAAPVTPYLLLPTAPSTPATNVPCPSRSVRSVETCGPTAQL